MVSEPRIVVVDGAREVDPVRLDDLFTLGRLPENSLQLLEPAVSRRHAEIRRDGDLWVLRDLGSRLGTFVNGLPVRERTLEHGDLIQVGRTLILFLLYGSSETIAAPLAEDLRPGESTVQLETDAARYLQPARRARRPPAGAGAAAIDLKVLLELSSAFHEERDAGALAARLLELLPDVLPPARAAVLLSEPGEEAPRTAASRLPEEAGEPFAASRRVVERVMRDGVGLLCVDVGLEGDLESAESLRQGAVRSVLAAPLMGRERNHGVLYFDACEPRAFDEGHLELVTAAGAIAGLAFDTARHVERLTRENRRLRDERSAHGMVGESAAMRRLFQVLDKVGRTESTVLLRGESGTGKELAARALHRSSPRADGPFVAVNCASLSETLLESDLFGHEKGAFTGAVARKTGRMEAADGGTLFLDEVGEIPVALQAKILRALQEREIERVGGKRPIAVDLRVIAASHQDLEAAIREGRFREDLFYRLNVIDVTLPALRSRRDDIPLLARHFSRRHGDRLGLPAVSLADDARRALVAYDWPGNVRQLSNVIERALVLGDGEAIRLEDLPEEVLDQGAREGDLGRFQATMVETKVRLITEALDAAGGNAAEAARRLGVHPNSLRRLVRQLGLKDAGGGSRGRGSM